MVQGRCGEQGPVEVQGMGAFPWLEGYFRWTGRHRLTSRLGPLGCHNPIGWQESLS